jgi:DNA-binding response OmpR family regulator
MVPQPLQPARTARILVIEDEVLTRALIAEDLRLAGFSVIEADRADDALTYIKAGKQSGSGILRYPDAWLARRSATG